MKIVEWANVHSFEGFAGNPVITVTNDLALIG
jgi:hypothetical protein